MAFTKRPETEEQAREFAAISYASNKIDEIAKLFTYLKSNYTDISKPLVLADFNGGNRVTVSPLIWQRLEKADIKAAENALKTAADVSLNIHFGNGSGGPARVGYNMGNAAEGILAAAIAARFINKTKTISNSDVKSVLRGMIIGKNQNSTSKTFQSENYKTPIKDDVNLSIMLSPVNMMLVFPEQLFTNGNDGNDLKAEAILNREKLITPCVAYANSREITQLAHLVYYNRVKDVIQVTADGITGETTTKVDVRLSINGRESITIPARYRLSGSSSTLNITQVSLKREVDQFAQVGGWHENFLKDFWGKILNDSNFATKDSVKNVYDNIQANGAAQQAAEVMNRIYQIATEEFNEKYKNISNRDHFINVLHQFATKNERNVQMVELVGGGYIRFNFNDPRFKKLLEDPDVVLKANFSQTNPTEKSKKIGATSLPVVTISAIVQQRPNRPIKKSEQNSEEQTGPKPGTYDLVRFRAKIEWGQNVVRNYVEKQKGLIDFVGSQ